MENLLYEKRDKIGILSINRPNALNALNYEVLRELETFFDGDEIRDIKVLIFTGSGEKAFIAGADIKEMNSLSNVEMLHFSDLGQKVTRLIETIDIVTIAAVNGFALGGGLEMALACDFIYASDNAKVGQPEVTLGVIPGFGGTQRLSRAVGERIAKEMIYTGKVISAKEAKDLGIVNKVVEQKDLMEEVQKVAGKIINNGFFAVTQAKRAINSGYNLTITEALELEKQMFALSASTDECTEGMSAFIEKRKPNFN